MCDNVRDEIITPYICLYAGALVAGRFHAIPPKFALVMISFQRPGWFKSTRLRQIERGTPPNDVQQAATYARADAGR